MNELQINKLKELKLKIEKNSGYLKTDAKNSRIFKTIEVNEDVLVDVNSDGIIVGIELLNPLEQLGIKYKKTHLSPANFIDKIAFQLKDSL